MTDPTNKERAARIDNLIDYYATQCKGDAFADESDVQDIITDIMHWCQKEEQDFEELLRFARDNFEAEVDDGTSGQDRESYTDDQDRENYTC